VRTGAHFACLVVSSGGKTCGTLAAGIAVQEYDCAQFFARLASRRLTRPHPPREGRIVLKLRSSCAQRFWRVARRRIRPRQSSQEGVPEVLGSGLPLRSRPLGASSLPTASGLVVVLKLHHYQWLSWLDFPVKRMHLSEFHRAWCATRFSALLRADLTAFLAIRDGYLPHLRCCGPRRPGLPFLARRNHL